MRFEELDPRILQVIARQLDLPFDDLKLYRSRAIARFLPKVRVSERGCWLWQGAINDKKSEFPYGVFRYRGRKMYAHRVSYLLFRGPLRSGKEIMHRPSCESESCVHPHHLSQGLHSTNMSKEWTRRYWGDGKAVAA